MNTISLCMIVKNEEERLADCLSSVRDIADEIVIADTGSTDATKQVAGGFTDKIFDFLWVDDFSAARNFSFSKATMEYILWLDADDVFLPENREKLKKLKEELDPAVDVVMMKYHAAFDENEIATFSYYRERQFRWREPVHEYLEIGGSILHTDIAVTHRKNRASPSERNLAIYRRILDGGGKLTPRGRYY